jgi:hypothetical protein
VPFDLLEHWANWRRGAHFRKWFHPFDSSDLHYFAWDFTSEVTVPRSIISVVLWGIWRPLGERSIYWSSFIQEGANQIRGLCIEWGRTSPFVLRLQEGTLLAPIYSLASSSEYLEVFGSRAELLRVFSIPAGRSSTSLGVWHFIRPRSHLVFIYCIQEGLWRLVASLLHLIEDYLHFVMIY